MSFHSAGLALPHFCPGRWVTRFQRKVDNSALNPDLRDERKEQEHGYGRRPRLTLDCAFATELAQSAKAVVCIVQPPDWRIYITPTLVLISAVIAFLAMLNTRSVARQKATLDLIEKTESTEHYRKLNETFSRLRRSGGFDALANPKTDSEMADRQAVMDYLNHYELVSIGIRHSILDDEFYRAWMRGPFVRDWNAAKSLVQLQRWKKKPDGTWEYYDKVFENYQFVACRWSREVEYLTEESGGPPALDESGGPANEPLPAPPNGERADS